MMDKDKGYVDELGLHGKYSGNFGYSTSTTTTTFDGNNNNNNNQMVDYMLNNISQATQAQSPGTLSFADVMQLADLGPKLTLNQTNKLSTASEGNKLADHHGTTGIDFLKFPVLNDIHNKIQMINDHNHDDQSDDLMVFKSREESENVNKDHIRVISDHDQKVGKDDDKAGSMHQLLAIHGESPTKGKRKRPRTIKTSQEVESQRMTHIAVERNRRKQMNEHLRVLRSLMPGSYVQRGDQASIIGGAIEFVRELEQLLQCLESQKRRRLYGDLPGVVVDPSSSSPGPGQAPALASAAAPGPPQLIFPNQDQLRFMELEAAAAGIQEEIAESKSCLADVEVKMLGFDGMIKILSRRRPGQLTKAIEALEEHLQMNILHTNITTMEQTVLYSFNVKVGSDAMFTAEDIANSVQQIFGFIHTNTIEAGLQHP